MGDLLREALHEITADPARFLAEAGQSLVLIAILWWMGGRWLRPRLEARRARIIADLADADAASLDAARLRQEAGARMAGMADAAAMLVRQANAEAVHEKEAELARVEAEAEAIIAQATKSVERERARLAEDAARRLVALTAEATRRYLDEMLSDSDRRGITQLAIRASLAQLKDEPTPGAEGA